MRIRPLHWLILIALSLLWGSSYLLIAMALTSWSPGQLTGLRVTLAAAVLLFAVMARGGHIPRKPVIWGYFLLIAVIGNCLPFFLISWGQQQVESGLAGILSATSPLMVLILAHFMLPDEPLRRRHLVSFLMGFAGIVLLMGGDSLAGWQNSGDRLLAQLAILGGAVCYAAATILARRMPMVAPLVTSAAVMLLAGSLMSPLTIQAAGQIADVELTALLALAVLGLAGTGVASILYFYLINQTGARFTSLLNYLVPCWAMFLGSVILGEELRLSAWLALILIISGLIFISRFDDIATR